MLQVQLVNVLSFSQQNKVLNTLRITQAKWLIIQLEPSFLRVEGRQSAQNKSFQVVWNPFYCLGNDMSLIISCIMRIQVTQFDCFSSYWNILDFCWNNVCLQISTLNLLTWFEVYYKASWISKRFKIIKKTNRDNKRNHISAVLFRTGIQASLL